APLVSANHAARTLRRLRVHWHYPCPPRTTTKSLRSPDGSAGDQPPSRRLPIDPDVTIDPLERIAEPSTRFVELARRTLVARWDILLVIAAGGALGSLARWALGEAFAGGRGSFPWATALENVSGGLALGVLM